MLGGSAMLLDICLLLLLKYQRGKYVANREVLLIIGYLPIVLLGAVQQSECQGMVLRQGASCSGTVWR